MAAANHAAWRRDSPMRTFDPVRLGLVERDAWAAYYRRDWRGVLHSAVGMVDAGFGLPRRHTLVGAWWVLRANQAWAPYPDNDPDRCRALMARFYRLVASVHGEPADPDRAAAFEVRWWAAHRDRQRGAGAVDPLVAALTDLYAEVYAVAAAQVQPAAALRAAAMDVSDRWVAAGASLTDPQLDEEGELLVRSYTHLRGAVGPA